MTANRCRLPSSSFTGIVTLKHEDEAATESKYYRDIVLIGHGLNSDLIALFDCGSNVKVILRIAALLEMSLIDEQVYKAEHKIRTLGDLLSRLGCPFEKSALHDAGNDATFTLKGLIALAIESNWKSSEEKLTQTHRISHE